MRRVSPSSWLVIAAVAIAVIALYAAGAAANGRSSGGANLGAPASSSAESEIPARPSSVPAPTGVPAAEATPTEGPTAPPTPAPAARCEPSDQDRYVYHPARLEVLASCIRMTGVVEAVRKEADGDLHILLALDPAYADLLRPANQGVELGDLVVEPVCVGAVTQTDAIALCTDDPDPLPGPFPPIGRHVWMEGRYVLDHEHGDWAELHPLYRWGASGG